MTDKQKAFYTIDEVSEILGLNRNTVYEWIKRLSIKRHKFQGNKMAFLSAEDVAKIRDVRENQPWLAPEREREEPSLV